MKRSVTNQTSKREQALSEINSMIRQNAKVKKLSPIARKMVRQPKKKPEMISRRTSSYGQTREMGIDEFFILDLVREEEPEYQEDGLL